MSLICQHGNWSIINSMRESLSHVRSAAQKVGAGFARLSCSLSCCSCCFEFLCWFLGNWKRLISQVNMSNCRSVIPVGQSCGFWAVDRRSRHVQATRAGSNRPALWASIDQILPFVSTAVKRSHECSIDCSNDSFFIFLDQCHFTFAFGHAFSWVTMAQAERWTFKILSLPVFDRTFAEAIAQSPLVNPTFVIALGAESAGEFTSIVSRICESFDTKVTDVLCSETDKLEQFWSLIIASEKLFLEASTQQLGFGLYVKPGQGQKGISLMTSSAKKPWSRLWFLSLRLRTRGWSQIRFSPPVYPAAG